MLSKPVGFKLTSSPCTPKPVGFNFDFLNPLRLPHYDEGEDLSIDREFLEDTVPGGASFDPDFERTPGFKF